MPVMPSQSVGQIVNNLTSAALLGTSPSTSRQSVDSMFTYTLNSQAAATVQFPGEAVDWRVRITLPPGANYFYNDTANNHLLQPLNVSSDSQLVPQSGSPNTRIQNSNAQIRYNRFGVVFPYTPSMSVTHTANYTKQSLTHNNYAQYFYDNSEVQPINITADFTVQNINEGKYLLAAIYFFRSLTKMFFGKDGTANNGTPSAGNPPPIVYLNGYGQYYFPNVPVVVTSFQHTMPADCDYINIPDPAQYPYQSGGGSNSVGTRLPTTSSITLIVQPVYSRLAQSQGFSLNDFAAGALVNNVTTGSATALGASAGAVNVGAKFTNGGFL
jgi:hypothetical protein